MSQVEKYLESKKNTWSPSTLKSETSRLRKLAPLVNKPAGKVFDQLVTEGYDAYGIKTAMIRLSDFYSFLHPNNENPFKTYMTRNARYFKRAYQSKPVKATFEQLAPIINSISDPLVKAKIEQLRASGMRWTESHTIDEAGYITGKGGKRRKVYVKAADRVSYYAVYRELKKHGLTPHMIRKLFFTEFAQLPSVTMADLCAAAGWSSPATALRYLQAKNEERIGSLVEQVTK